MSIKKSPSPLKKVLIVVLLLFLGSFLFVTTQIWHYFNIKPINSSQTYYRDSFGNIYRDATTGCLDICLVKTFKKLSVDKNTFTVLMVNNPFTRIHKTGELIESNYATDKAQVFYRGEQVISADPSSFKAVSYDLGKDKNQYFIYNKPLHIYITEEISQTNKFTPESLEVISYNPSEYLVLKVNASHYYVKLNPQPKTIEEITSASVSKYPKL